MHKLAANIPRLHPNSLIRYNGAYTEIEGERILSKRLLITFHSLILLFAIGAISAYFFSTTFGREVFYLILAIIIGLSSIFNIVRLSLAKPTPKK